MITKKCHKLENTLKEEDEKNNEEENNEPKEILIVDVNNNLEEDEEEKEAKEGDDQNEKSINYSKSKLSKPKPILNVDSNSINITDYQVNDNNNNNKYSNYNYSNYNYPSTRYNFYTGSSYYLPKSYSFYCNSNYNNGFRNTNSHFNNLSSSNDYTYRYKNNNNYPYANNNDNNSITYSFYSQHKPNNLRSRSFVKLQNKYNIDDNNNLRNSKGNNLSISQRSIPCRYNDGNQNNFYPTKERVTYVLNYYKNNVGSNFNNKNNTYRAYNKSLPYKINYNYIYNWGIVIIWFIFNF